MADIESSSLDHKERFSTGFKSLDNLLGGGFYFGQLAIITGVRGDGKSTLGSQFLTHAISQNYKCLAYSGELPGWQFKNWIERQIAGPGNIEKGSEDYYLKTMDKRRISAWMGDRFYSVDDDSALDEEDDQTLMEILESAVYQYGCKVILIDNLMTALEDDMASDLYRQQTKFIKTLVSFAKTTETFIILIAHPKKNDGRNFTNDSISGSGNIMNLAQIILRYFRPEELDDGSTPCDRKLALTKNRNTGKTNEKGIDLYFDESTKRISERYNDFSWNLGWEESMDDQNDGFIDADPDDLPEELTF